MPLERPHAGLGISVADFGSSSSPCPTSPIRHRAAGGAGGSILKQPSGIANADPTDADPSMHGVSDLRDGFFDAFFHPPRRPPPSSSSSTTDLATTLPAQFEKSNPLSVRAFLPRQLHELVSALKRTATTRAGIRLSRSFAAYGAAYALCLVPVVRGWLGRYAYVTCISVLVNHPGRTVGSQLDGALLTSVGTALGLGWGVIGLLLSTSTLAARTGFGGILAVFLAVFLAASAIVRSYFIRSYQAVLSAGLAICYACLAESHGAQVNWPKLRAYGVPWLVGQAIALAANLLIFPDAGARPLAQAFHEAFAQMDEALMIPRPRNAHLRRRLTSVFVDLSTAYRDMRIELTVTRFAPHDVRDLRNIFQAVIRSLLAVKTETKLFNGGDAAAATAATASFGAGPPAFHRNASDFSTEGGGGPAGPSSSADGQATAGDTVVAGLGSPIRELLSVMRESLQRCDAALMDLSGYRKYLGPAPDVSSDVSELPRRIRDAMAMFDAAEAHLLDSDADDGGLRFAHAPKPEVVRLFLFARHIRLAATSIEALAVKVHGMMRCKPAYPVVHLPMYPLRKALKRTNAQVRHDRGGVTAGHYHMTFREIAHLVKNIRSQDHEPLPRDAHDPLAPTARYSTAAASAHAPLAVDPKSYASMDAEDDVEIYVDYGFMAQWRHRAWKLMHRLQGFESRYALKVVVLTLLLSIPAWLDERSRTWWNRYEAWWAVSTGWLMTHPRVGGNLQDLVTRTGAAFLGAAWSGAAFVASGRTGNPVVMAVFMVLYMLPMLYRYSISSHPRSGIAGCFSFTVISLSLLTDDVGKADTPPVIFVVWMGLVFVVGVVGGVVINWVLWPFVARHELRKALSAMLFFQSIIYRTIVAKYIYYEVGNDPTPEDIERSEMLEGRLREGFVRIHQLLSLTRHEIRLRAPFNPLPYSALADACERFFEHIVAVRQATMVYSPKFARVPGYPDPDDPDADVDGDGIRDADANHAFGRLLACRRDTVAAILCNLYILSGALRSQSKIPRYLPSASAARQRLFDKMSELEAELGHQRRRRSRLAEVYSYSYNESLTGCVTQLEALERYAKMIVGETGFDAQFRNDEDEDLLSEPHDR